MAATFDPEIVHEVGTFLAAEAKVKSSVVLLAPTCNIQRSPLGGRAFESFSEDPHLSGTFLFQSSPTICHIQTATSGIMASAYVNGLQSEGLVTLPEYPSCHYLTCVFRRRVAATIKHFVANDQEHERTAADSVVSERALREIYLYPFVSMLRTLLTATDKVTKIHVGAEERETSGIYDLVRAPHSIPELTCS